MHFRLAYAEPLRRRSYAESRWDAPPAELLDAFLKRRIVYGQPDFSGTGCRLQVMLSELQQRFDEPQSSTLVLEVHALLTPLRSAEILSKRAFVVQVPVTIADARGGAAATRDAVEVLTGDLAGWLNELSRDKPAVAGRCRA
jgi:cholesterol transport system auxiliary component